MVDEPVPSDDGAAMFGIHGHLQTLIALRLIEPGDERFFLVLQKALARSAEFFRHAPGVHGRGADRRASGGEPGRIRPALRHAPDPGRAPERRRCLEPDGDQRGLALIQAGRPVKLRNGSPRPEEAAPPRNADPS